MQKRLFIIICSLLILIAGLIATLFVLKKPEYKKAIDLLPSNTALFIETSDLGNLLQKLNEPKLLPAQIIKSPELSTIRKAFEYFSNFKTEGAETIFTHKHAVFSIQNQAKNGIGMLLLIEDIEEEQFNQILGKISGNTQLPVDIKELDKKAEIFQITFQNQNTPFTLVIKQWNNLLLISNKPELLKQISQNKTTAHGLLSDTGMQKLRKTAGKNELANIYFHFDRLAKLLIPASDSAFIPTLKSIQKFGGWAEYDLSLNAKGIALNGYCNLIHSSGGQLDTIEWEAAASLPDNCLFLYSSSIPNEKNNLSFADKAILCSVPASDSLPDASTLAILRLKKTLSAQWLALADSLAKPETLKMTNDSLVKIYFLNDSLPLKSLGEPFLCRFSYLFKYNGNIVLAQDKNALKTYLQKISTRSVLSALPSYTEFSANLTRQSNLLIYINLKALQPLLKQWFDTEYLAMFTKINQAAVQFTIRDSMAYSNAIIEAASYNGVPPEAQWSVNIEAGIQVSPTLLNADGTSFLFVQDKNFILHTYNSVGESIWKTKLDGSLLGDIQSIKLKNDEKPYFLCSTSGFIYLFDNRGLTVAGFPIKLKSKATAPVSATNYNNTSNYRFFISCENKLTLAFDQDGSVLKGWKPFKTLAQVKDPVQFFLVGEKDFVVFGDSLRTYLLDRKGLQRVKPKGKSGKMTSSLYYFIEKEGKKPECLLFASPEGKTHILQFDGKTYEKKIAGQAGWNSFTCTMQKPYRVCFVENKHIEAYTLNGAKLWSYEFEENSILKAKFYYFSDNEVGVSTTTQGPTRSYCFNIQGSLLSGFPLEGNFISYLYYNSYNDFILADTVGEIKFYRN